MSGHGLPMLSKAGLEAIRVWTTRERVIEFTSIAFLAVPPPRCFVAIASDLVQLILLLGAVLAAVIVWVGSIVPPSGPGLTQDVAFKTTDELDKIRGQLVRLLGSYLLTILLLVITKSLCVWLDDGGALRWLIKRSAMAFAGLSFGISLAGSSQLADAHGFLHTGRNISFWLLSRPGRGAPAPRNTPAHPKASSDDAHPGA
jgi:hypothetical protein